MSTDRETRADAKLKNLPRQIRDELWRMRNPEDDGEKVRYVDILMWLKSKGIESSLGALTPYYAWEKAERRIERAHDRANQARENLAKDPNATAADVARVGQIVFTSEVVESGNVKAFVALERLRMEREKMEEATKSKIEAGLDALFEQIQGNPQALVIYQQLREVVKAA